MVTIIFMNEADLVGNFCKRDYQTDISVMQYNERKVIYYPTALHRVQIMPKMSTNIMGYLYSRRPVRQVFSQRASNKLD